MTACRSAKRTRTVTVRPGRDFALSRLATRSARCSSTGPKIRASAGRLPSADCAPAECDRLWVSSFRGSRFHASDARDRKSTRLLDADLGQPRLGRRADAPHQADRQIMQEGKFGVRIDHHQAVGLGHLRGDLGQMLGARHADRDRQAELCPDAPTHRGGDLGRRPEQMRAAGDVGKGFIDGNPLDQRREIVEHLDGGVAQPLIVGEMAADEDQSGAKLARALSGHAAAHAENPGFVGSGKHDAAADGDRLAPERRVEQLLDRGVEGVEIRMQDGGLHPDRSLCGVAALAASVVRGVFAEQIENKQGLLSSEAVVAGRPVPGRAVECSAWASDLRNIVSRLGVHIRDGTLFLWRPVWASSR
ncbi:hypothetical protein X771_24470 [Mesorhizobium sp. LSJC277A00]|nr:hypothetical protein X771_24470 [Mesorhizobium sp. LSJC277A00]